MDPHFREYMAAVAGMQEVYGFDDGHAAAPANDVRIEFECPQGRPTAAETIPAVVGCR
jgi:hypothetical protein